MYWLLQIYYKQYALVVPQLSNLDSDTIVIQSNKMTGKKVDGLPTQFFSVYRNQSYEKLNDFLRHLWG